MNQRNFFKTGTLGAFSIGGLSVIRANGLHWQNQEGFLREPARDVPIAGEYNVIVCGAGPAGVSAAIESGRSGASPTIFRSGP